MTNQTFHMLRIGILVLPLLSTPSCQGPGSLTGRPTRTIPGWGEVSDLAGDCSIKAFDNSMTIVVPGGSVHTLSDFFAIRNAPRVLREVDGDFTVQVKVSGTFEPGGEPADGVAASGRNSFNGAGLLLWENDDNYLRVERNIWVTPDGKSYAYLPLLEYWKNNRIVAGSGGQPDDSGNAQCTYLRMTRQGQTILAEYSGDGVKWIKREPVTIQFPSKVKLGVAATNSSKKPLTVQFSDFKLALK